MRNVFTYSAIDQENLLIALLNKAVDTECISVLYSNLSDKKSDLPKDYINYDLIAGIGSKATIRSNSNSFEKLYEFHSAKKDWMFGYLSYDIKNEIEDLSSDNVDHLDAANLLFFVPEYVLLLKNDVLEIQSFATKKECDNFVESFNNDVIDSQEISLDFKRRDEKEAYLKKIEQIKCHIQRGDIYEMNYCQEFYAEGVEISAEDVFLELNKRMNVPFSSFFKLKDKYILSASPERFLRKKGSEILSQPIKGTRKRGLSNKEDEQLIKELRISQKDISENVMITDLVRNDLSITATKGSVSVAELCGVYTFEKVHQMITTITSEVDEKVHFSTILKSVFPMGSMTGAPKLKAMELIEEFESFKRGVFSGAIGYITPKGDFDFNVVIRTILYNASTKYLSVGVGGAITIKSDAEEEYEECLVKVKPIFDVLNFQLDEK